jgi:hypothetical protein
MRSSNKESEVRESDNGLFNLGSISICPNSDKRNHRQSSVVDSSIARKHYSADAVITDREIKEVDKIK